MADETVGKCYADKEVGDKFYSYHICKYFDQVDDPGPGNPESCCGICKFWAESEGPPADIGYCTRKGEKE